MEGLSKMSDKRYELLILVSLLLMAFCVRLLAFIISIDSPGDALTYAIWAYNWAESPHVIDHDIFLPGFNYISGIFSFIVHDPWVSTRILNLLIGTLTVPVFYLLICRVFDSSTAIFSASILVFLPLHVGLSDSSMMEVTNFFEIISGVTLLIKATESKKRQALYLSVSLFCFCLALMTRYESWLLILPLVPSYYYLKRRRLVTAILIMMILAIVPATEMLTNYLNSGDLLPGYSTALTAGPNIMPQASAYYPKVDLDSALKILVVKSINQLGLIMFITILCGGVLQFDQTIRGKISSERILYVLMLSIFWAFMLYFCMGRGKHLWDRYLLIGLVMSAPLALLPLNRCWKNYRRWIGIIIFVAIFSVVFNFLSQRPIIYITRKQPTEIIKLTAWLKKSSYRDDAILLTKLRWESKYLPLYFPETGPRHLVFSHWTKDAKIQDFLKNCQPSILISCDEDLVYQSRLEPFLGMKIQEDSMVHSEGYIRVYALRTPERGQGEEARY